MNSKTLLFIIILFLPSAFVPAQIPQQVEKTLSGIILSASQFKSVPEAELNSLDSIFNQDESNIEFEKEYYTTEAAYDSLKDHLKEFESVLPKISVDSALVLLNGLYLHSSRTFYTYNKEKHFSSPGIKILFFSTSVSCACTLEMCRDQLIDILNFRKANDNKYDFWVIDSYWNNDLQIKYDAYFTPSVLVLNGNNEVINKIEYDEQMINKLTNYSAVNNKGEK